VRRRGGHSEAERRGPNAWLRLAYPMFRGLAERLESSRLMRDLRSLCERGGISVHFRAYLAGLLFAAIVVPIAALALSAAVHIVLLGYPPIVGVALSLIVAFASAMVALGAFLAAPIYRSRRWRGQIEGALPHMVNYMETLASAGLPPEHIFERVAEANINPAVTRFARMVVAYVRLFGMDIVSALRRALEASPSVGLSRLVAGMMGVISTSGDLRSYLAFEGEALLRAQRDRLRRLVSSLGFIAEVYVGLVMVGPVIFVIMSVVLDMLGGTIMGLSPSALTMAFIFTGVPLLFAAFLLLLDSMLARV